MYANFKGKVWIESQSFAKCVTFSLILHYSLAKSVNLHTEQKKVKAFELCSSDASRDVIAVITLPSIVCNLVSCTN